MFLILKINSESPICQEVHIGKRYFKSVSFMCRKYNRPRICEVTVNLKLWKVEYFLKVDGQEYDFPQVF